MITAGFSERKANEIVTAIVAELIAAARQRRAGT
jgi:type III secretory pathway lipoprotein EscJ